MRFTIDHCFMLSTSSGAGSGEFAWIGVGGVCLDTGEFAWIRNT